jgi:hypothetical protein
VLARSSGSTAESDVGNFRSTVSSQSKRAKAARSTANLSGSRCSSGDYEYDYDEDYDGERGGRKG